MTDEPHLPDGVRVRAPATSANLGPGFDSFGLALGLYDEVAAAPTPGGLSLEISGEGAGDLPRDERNLIIRALRATVDELGGRQPGLRITCHNSIPHARGLGSSAAAIVTGVLLGEAFAEGTLAPGEALELATALEGHPDNVAACLLGGFTVAWMADTGTGSVATSHPTTGVTAGSARRNRAAQAVRLDVHPDVSPFVFVPATSLSTELARAALPAQVAHPDAARTAGRAGLLVAALTAHPEYLLAATADWLHQECRLALMPETGELLGRLRRAGVPAVVSGAGPGVLAFGRAMQPVDPGQWTPSGWRVVAVPVDATGAERSEGTQTWE